MLLASGDVLDEAQRKRLTSDIHEDANWLINLVENLLSVTRLDDGDVEVSRAPELVSDVLADALRHVSRFVSEHRLTVEIEDEFLLAQMDGRLIVQVVVNLLNNAIAYTPAGSVPFASPRIASAALPAIGWLSRWPMTVRASLPPSKRACSICSTTGDGWAQAARTAKGAMRVEEWGWVFRFAALS